MDDVESMMDESRQAKEYEDRCDSPYVPEAGHAIQAPDSMVEDAHITLCCSSHGCL